MKNFLMFFLFVCWLLFSVPVLAFFNMSSGVASLSDGDDTAMNVFLKTDIEKDPWSLGFNVNIVFPEDKRPQNLDLLVLRHMEYDDGIWGIRLGTLERLTYGYGLIMNNYSTVFQGSSLMTNEQLGLRFYTKAFPVKVDAFAARNNIYGIRFTEDFWPDLIFGRPLILGQTFVCDPDGVEVNDNVVGKGQAAVGLDMSVPIIDNTWDVYTEYGMLLDSDPDIEPENVAGFALGTQFLISEMLKFDFKYFGYEQGFVPGYFGAQYETAPYNLSSTENLNSDSRNGWSGTISFFLSELLAFDATYQKFEGEDYACLSGSGIIGTPGGIKCIATYEQPRFYKLSDIDDNEATIKVDIQYPIGNNNSFIIHYKRVAISGDDIEEFTSVEYSYDIGNFNFF